MHVPFLLFANQKFLPSQNRFSKEIISSKVLFNFFFIIIYSLSEGASGAEVEGPSTGSGHNKKICLNSNPLIPPNASQTELPLLTKLSEAYKLWHGLLPRFPCPTRYTLGAKIDNLFSDCLELALLAGYANREEKLKVVQKLSAKLDCLKFFLKILWEIKSLDHKKYAALSLPIAEVGKMIGGWLKLLKQTPPVFGGE